MQKFLRNLSLWTTEEGWATDTQATKASCKHKQR